MPIRPENKALYPANWKELRAEVLTRASHACEGSPTYPTCRARNHEPHPVTSSRVVLTIAHLDHNPTNNDLTNLRAWCQRCHVTYDADHHASTAARTRKKRLEQAGQLTLFCLESADALPFV